MPRVVYVDDEPRLLEITKDFLESSGEIDVDAEESATKALGKISQSTYDVIVSDYQMPEMDGIELLKAIRMTGDKTPFILFTGRGREEVAIEALNCGADFYLQKGGDPKVQFRELKNAICQLTQRKHAEALVAHGERKYRDLVEGANSIILKVDPNGNTVFLNQFGMEFFEAGPSVLGRPVIGSLIRPQDYPEYDVAEHFTAFLTSKRFGESYTFPVLKGGKEAWVSWTVRAVLDAEDRAVEFLVIGNDVTALKKTEMKLQHSTAVLRATLDSSDEGILVISNDGSISEHNLRFLDLWKVPTSIIESRSERRLVDYADRQLKEPGAFLRFIGECQARPDMDHDRVLEMRDGRIIEVHSTPERIGNRVAGRFFSFKDVTRQKLYETGLLQQKENIRSLFISNPANMLLIEPDTGLIVHANDAACRFYGYAKGAISKMRLSDISTLPFEEFWDRMRSARNNEKNYFIAPHRLENGEIKDVEIFLAPINYKRRVLLFGIVQDISGTKSASRLLEESELRHNRILDCISEGIVAIDCNEKIVYANEKTAQVLRLPLDRIVGQDPWAFISEESAMAICSNLVKRRKGEKGHADYRMRRGDGTEFWASVSANPIISSGAYAGTVYALNDITERREAEEALREGEHFVKHVLSTDPTGIMVYDLLESRIVYVNDRVTKVTGRTLEQLQGTEEVLESMVHPDDLPALIETTIKAAQGADDEVNETEVRVKDADGGWRWVHFYGTPFLRDAEGNVIQTISGIRDISDQKKAEMEVRKVRHKLELLSDVTRHDIRNQVTMIMGNIELSRLPTSNHADRLERIERAATIINSHIEFANDYQELGTTEPVWQSVARTVQSLDIGKGVGGLEISDLARRLEICADPMLRKVFHNLLEDSIKYAGPQARVRIDCHVNEGNLTILYQDDGPGVPTEEKELIFAKGHGRGTGLGLFLSREILAITGISITEMGQPGQGVMFEMNIPAGQFRFQ